MERKDLLQLMMEKHLTLSCMESLTGGLFATSFTSVPGASEVFLGGAVAYSNKVKESFGVKNATIEKHGAISRECADEMALKASLFFHSDCSVSFTGNAGPSAEEDKPVGLVYISIHVKNKLYSYQLNLNGDREDIRRQCVDFAFSTLFDKIKAENI